jgi:flagellin-specific chaperone FliS
MDKLEGKLQTLRFILSRPNSDIKEFTNTINESKDIVQEVKSFLNREQETM